MSAFAVVVYGKPQPAGSKRAFVNPRTKRAIVVDDAKGSRPWKQEVAGAALDVCGGEPLLLDGALVLEVRFYLRRPKGHYGSGKNARQLRGSAPAFPAVKPDTTKLLRAVEDALTGIVWTDDSRIVHQVASKCYGTPERCEIRVDRAPAPIIASRLEVAA
jgi:Holliday junction resolvase RusA-like endonuclease